MQYQNLLILVSDFFQQKLVLLILLTLWLLSEIYHNFHNSWHWAGVEDFPLMERHYLYLLKKLRVETVHPFLSSNINFLRGPIADFFLNSSVRL